MEDKKPFVITPAYDKLLRGDEAMPIGLYHLHKASTIQLTRLHYSEKSVRRVKALLRTLIGNGYVQFDATPTALYRSPYYYTLTNKGIEYLRDIGWDVPDSFRASKEVGKNYLFIQHALGLNDVLTSAALLKRQTPNYYLDSFIHERELKQKPYQLTWQGEKLSLIPDSLLDFRSVMPDGSKRHMPVLLEHDGGTEGQRHFRRRIRAYITLLKSGTYTIAFTTFVGPKRLAQMREWTRQELAVTNESKAVGFAFRFASLTPPLNPSDVWLKPCWYTPYTIPQTASSVAGCLRDGVWKTSSGRSRHQHRPAMTYTKVLTF